VSWRGCAFAVLLGLLVWTLLVVLVALVLPYPG
jgi:hypothetical protein